jgi:tetratricopeptide (TPR) repeat protein
VIGALAVMALVTFPTVALAQEDCVGESPKGGMYATSAELYLDRARQNADPEDKAKLYRQAVDVLRDGFERQPDNPRNYELAGQAFVGLNQYAAADSAYTTAVEMWSCYSGRIDTLRYNAWVPAFNRAVGYSQQGNEERALESYQAAWTIYKELPQSMLQIGTIYTQRALTAETDEEREELQEKAIEAYSVAADVLAQRPARLSEAQQQEYGRAATFNMAQLLAFEERFEEAGRAYTDFLEQEPGNVDAMSNAAVVLTRAAGQKNEQAAELEDGPEKERLLAEADSLRSVANGFYDELLAREDLGAGDYHNIGLGLIQIGIYEQAKIAFRKALEIQPYRLNSLEQLARVVFAAQQYDTLAVVAKTLVERYPLSLDNLALLANAYRETEELDNALATLERREALPCEISDLELESEEGTYTIRGYLVNLHMAPDAPIELQFDFYDDSGEVVSSETATVTAPAEQGSVSFDVTTESEAGISGFAYKPLNLETTSAGT